MKRFLSVIISIVMILALSVNVMAADTKVTITGDDTANREYKAYKLMDASVSGTNFAYEVNSKYSAILIEELSLDSTATSKQIVEELNKITAADNMRHFADDVYRKILAAEIEHDATWKGNETTLPQGYWLISDVTDLSGQDKSNSLIMVDTVGDTEMNIASKPDSITTEKKVDDENDSLVKPSPTSEDDVTLQDTADYDIGDEVPYTIDIQMPNNVAAYKYYSFIIQDSVAEGLTYTEDSFELLVNNKEVALAKAGTSEAATADFIYEVDTELGADNKQVSQKLYVYPAKGYTNNADTDVVASKENGGNYLAYFNSDAPHSEINESTVVFKYTCKLNENAVVGSTGNPNNYTLKYSNNPFNDGFGKTPEDTVIVFTYKVIFNKVDPAGAALKGADFALYKFEAEKDQTLSDDQMIANGCIKHDTANAWGKYVLVDRKTTNAEIGEATVFNFNGLDDGFYILEETAPPAGYNAIEPLAFQIKADHVTTITSDPALTSVSATTKVNGAITLEMDKTEGLGTLTANIENRSGTELPSTGGMGRTIFYVTGSVVFIGAVIFLITKKRMRECK